MSRPPQSSFDATPLSKVQSALCLELRTYEINDERFYLI